MKCCAVPGLTICVMTLTGMVGGVSSARAGDKAGCTNPSWAPGRMPGFEISSCTHQDWARVTVSLASGDRVIEGEVDQVEFTLVDPSKNPTNGLRDLAARRQEHGSTRSPSSGHMSRSYQHHDSWSGDRCSSSSRTFAAITR